MNFNTAAFALFMLVVGLLYLAFQYLQKLRWQNYLLLGASYFFYGSWDFRFLFLIVLSTVLDFGCGLGLVGARPLPRLVVRLALFLVAACFLLLAPIDWQALWLYYLPAGQGGTEPLRLWHPAGDWRLFLGGSGLLLLLGIAFALGFRQAVPARRYFLSLSIVGNLGMLGFFKYYDFFVGSAAEALARLGLPTHDWLLGIVVPVGISFYTFQTLSYTIDIYRGELTPTDDVVDFALFVAYFPQLVAGPIERAVALLPQLQRPRQLRWLSISSGCYLVGWGLYKKIFIADNLARFVMPVYGGTAALNGPLVVLATYAFALQIYCDFSAYSDIARGVSRCLGIELMVNFNIPYAATSPREFWQRWHISLSTWLRDYLYIPLGGNRASAWGVFRNLMLTMVLGGLWHGARANFVLWGVYQGVLLCAHRLLAPVLSRIRPTGPARHLYTLICWFVFFQLTCYGWLLFRAESFAQIELLTRALLQGWADLGAELGLAARLIYYCWLLILVQACQLWTGNLLAPLNWPWPLRAIFFFLLFYFTVVFGAQHDVPFIYFQF